MTLPVLRRCPILLVILLASLLMSSALPVSAQDETSPLFFPTFTDTCGHWSEATLDVLYRIGVITGFEDGTFRPDEPITRLDFVVWVLRSIGEIPDEAGELPFTDLSDVPPERLADISRAVELGLVQGFSDGTFRPDGHLTRVQLATILGRHLMSLGLKPNTYLFQVFEDGHHIPEWAAPSACAVAKHIVIGRKAYRIFAPFESTTRAEAATMLERFMRVRAELKPEKSGPDLAVPPRSSYIVGGYYVGYDQYPGISYNTVDNYGSALDLVILASYDVGVKDNTAVLSGYDSEFLRSARDKHRLVLLAMVRNTGFSRENAHRILTEPRLREQAVQAIVAMVKEKGYDGLNIDFENVAPPDRLYLGQFMERLNTALGDKHLLTMAVPAKTWDNPNHGWSGAFDYRVLGAICDFLIPMAYDEHWSTSVPGPVASHGWVDAVVRYAVKAVSRDKLLLGIPLYGYDWLDSGAPNKAQALTTPQALQRAADHGAQIILSDTTGTPFYRYRAQDGSLRIVHFEDLRSLESKLKLAKAYGLRGVVFWRLGYEIPAAWPVITGLMH